MNDFCGEKGSKGANRRLIVAGYFDVGTSCRKHQEFDIRCMVSWSKYPGPEDPALGC